MAQAPAGAEAAPAGQRSAKEAAAPFLFPEAERKLPQPYTPGITIDTPLVVRGITIPAAEQKRHLCLGLGYVLCEYEKYKVFIGQELERRKAAGVDPRRFDVSDAEVEKFMRKQREEFARRYPTLDFETEVGRAYISHSLYYEPARQSIQFERLFMPDNPREWPEVSRELVRGFGGELFIQDAEESYDRRKQRMIDEGLEELPPDDPIIVGTWRDTILAGLTDFATIVTRPDQLPEGVLMSIDGAQVKIDTVWDKIAPFVTPIQLDTTRRYLAMTALLEQDLAAKKALMSMEDFEKAWCTNGRNYQQMLDAFHSMAVQMSGAPSSVAYAQVLRLIESAKTLYADDLNDTEKLRAQVAEVNVITGIGKVNAEVILSSAWDGDHVVWKDHGWADARTRSFDLKKQLDAGADWKETREIHSEFWDPPLPAEGQKPQFGLRFKGLLGEQTRNEFQTLLEEHETQEFVYGGTVTDRVFNEMPIGTTAGPFIGPKGYYIVRKLSHTPPMRPLDLQQDAHREIVRQFVLRKRLFKEAREDLEKGLSEGTVAGI